MAGKCVVEEDYTATAMHTILVRGHGTLRFFMVYPGCLSLQYLKDWVGGCI